MTKGNNLKLISAEFIGTLILSLVVLSAAKYFNFTAPWYVGLAVGISMMTLVLVLGRISGAHLNPAITIGLWSLRKIETSRAVVYISAQLLGGAVALLFFEYLSGLAQISVSSSEFDVRVFAAEMIGAFIFGFGVYSVVSQKLDGAQAAVTVGMSLFLGVLVASLAGPGYINPAVAVANNEINLTVISAPILGSVLGMFAYSKLAIPIKNNK